MKSFIMSAIKYAALGALIALTVHGFGNYGNFWERLLCFVGWGIVVGFARTWVLDQINNKSVTRSNKDLASIQEFLCESELLRGELVKFGERDYDARHHHHSGRKEGLPACNCSALLARTEPLVACEEFYGYLIDRHPEQYKHVPDGDYETSKARWEKEFQEKVKNTVLPIFERLHKAEPKAFPKDHIKWVTRKEMDEGELQIYLTWLIPSLKWGFEPVRTDEGKAAVADLEKLVKSAEVSNA